MKLRIAAALALLAWTAGAQKKRTTWDGVFSAEQAKRGASTYAARCASCHGETMGGTGGVPPVAGDAFLFSWNGKSAAELFDYVKTSMPPTDAGTLSSERTAELLAAIFERSGFPAGKETLPTDAAALGEITIQKDK